MGGPLWIYGVYTSQALCDFHPQLHVTLLCIIHIVTFVFNNE
jgi:hypothetical protein